MQNNFPNFIYKYTVSAYETFNFANLSRNWDRHLARFFARSQRLYTAATYTSCVFLHFSYLNAALPRKLSQFNSRRSDFDSDSAEKNDVWIAQLRH